MVSLHIRYESIIWLLKNINILFVMINIMHLCIWSHLKTLMYLIWSMLTNKKFSTWDGTNCSALSFLITKELHQGTVTSLVPFNIFNYQVLNIYGQNTPRSKSRSVAFADDLNVYVIDNTPDKNPRINWKKSKPNNPNTT